MLDNLVSTGITKQQGSGSGNFGWNVSDLYGKSSAKVRCVSICLLWCCSEYFRVDCHNYTDYGLSPEGPDTCPARRNDLI